MKKLFFSLLIVCMFLFASCFTTEELEQAAAENKIEVHLKNECAWSIKAAIKEKGILTFRDDFDLGHYKTLELYKNTQYTLYLKSRFDFEEVAFNFTTEAYNTTYIVKWDSFDGEYHLLVVQ